MTSFYIQTVGCAHNFADSEQMAGLLEHAQFNQTNLEEADVVIFNTCTVKSPTKSAFYKTLEETKEKYPYKIFIITGCIPQTEAKKLKEYPLVGTNQIHKIVEVVEEALNDNIVKALEMGEMPPLNLPRVRKNPIVQIIPISRGCLGACTFCKTKKARGNLRSYPIEDIVKEVKEALKYGVREVWLTSQDTFCYGFDIETNLPSLLEELLKIQGGFKIRIGMGNPDHLPKIGDRLIEMYKHPRIFKFLHLPLQAGDDLILKDMKRRYTVKEFVDWVKKFKAAIPELNFMTDIIVGYPTEKEVHFWGTLDVVRKLSPDSINISKFWARPGTKAEKLDQLPGDEIKRRSKLLSEIFHNISKMQNERWLNWEGEIIIDEKGTKENQWIGRNYAYRQILVSGDYKLGQIVKVKLKKANTFDLEGETIKNDN